MTDLTSTLIGFLSPSVNAFCAMTGCKMIIENEKERSITCILPLTVTGRKWNRMTITHNGLDLIDIVCEKLTVRNFKQTVKEVYRMENMFGEDVLRIFRETTGVATRLR